MFRKMLVQGVRSRRSIHTANAHSSAGAARNLVLIYSEIKNNKLSGALARRIQDELKAVYLVASDTDKIVDCPQVPFTVVITERTLTDGVLELRHHEPRIREEVHVSDLSERILLQTGAITTTTIATTAAPAAATTTPTLRCP